MDVTHGRKGPTTESDAVLTEVTLSHAVALQLAFVGTLGFFVSLVAFAGLYDTLVSGSPANVGQFVGLGRSSGILELLVLLVLAVAIVPPHEFVHGLAIRWFGGTPRYGVGLAHFVLPYAYATTDRQFSRNQFVVVALAPLVVLTVVGVSLMIVFEWAWLIVPLAANAGGAVGDCWMVLTVLGYPAHVRIGDNATGLQILGRPGDRPRGHWLTGIVWNAVIGAAVVPIGVSLLVPYVLLALDIESLTVGQPGSITLLFASASTASSYSFAVGPGSLLLGAGLGSIYAFVRSRVSNGSRRTPVLDDERHESLRVPVQPGEQRSADEQREPDTHDEHPDRVDRGRGRGGSSSGLGRRGVRLGEQEQRRVLGQDRRGRGAARVIGEADDVRRVDVGGAAESPGVEGDGGDDEPQ